MGDSLPDAASLPQFFCAVESFLWTNGFGAIRHIVHFALPVVDLLLLGEGGGRVSLLQQGVACITLIL